MKLRLALRLPDGDTHDVTLSCDVTATVSQLARSLIRAGFASDPLLARVAHGRLRPVTLRGRGDDAGPFVLLDPESPIVASGLQSGWTIEPVTEFGGEAAARVVEPAGYFRVLTGKQAGATYSLLRGRNTVGRDPGARVFLADAEVSRRHARIEIGVTGEAVLTDLGSVNGTRLDAPPGDEEAAQIVVSGAGVTLRGATTLYLGEVGLRFIPGPPGLGGDAPAAHTTQHMRSPRVEPSFPESTRELPQPPAPPPRARVPILAIVAPALMGAALYAITRSPMSLIMMAFSPLMMLGSWLDGKLVSRRKHRENNRDFDEAMAAERVALEVLREQELELRERETPATRRVTSAIRERSGLLWTRRPEQPSFLELRLGEGTLPSRTALTLPQRGASTQRQWGAVTELQREFSGVTPVPVAEGLGRCGALGIAGAPEWASGVARSVVLQLAGLHSPEEVVLACFADQDHAARWEWLKWLPHVDTVTSPLPAWQLADDEASTLRLLLAIEALIEARGGAPHHPRPGQPHIHLPAVVVLVLDIAAATRSRLIAVAESGPAAGVHVVWVARAQQELPAACHTFVAAGPATGAVGFTREATLVAQTTLETVDAAVAVTAARSLAAVEDAAAKALDESDLPKIVSLCDLHPVDLAGGGGPVARAWGDTLHAGWVPGTEREPVSLTAPVGQGPDGPAYIDLRVHGPHALVGGTTGAGKSEFLQTWIMSLAATVSPDRLVFLLVDYKGGAAFAECVDLPHTAGLVTDLSPPLVRRALTSLRAELRYREELLAEHGAKDLMTMERQSDPAAPPVLVIVIDEFAALAGEVPEFVDGVIDVAQRGRSLGLHLIMATQRPAGVIKDNLRANTNLRIALRMADEADSGDVIGVKDAAFFGLETPGRGAIKVGPGRISHFQTGYLGGAHGTSVAPGSFEIRSLGFTEDEPWQLPGEAPELRGARRSAQHQKPPRDIERLRDGIREAASLTGVAPPRRPWLDVLPLRLRLDAMPGRGADAGADTGAGVDAIVVGLRDLPVEQAQRPVLIDLERAGNIALIGTSGTGKTSALLTIAAALSELSKEWPVELFALDAAGGALDALTGLPTVAAVAPLADAELTGRVLARVQQALEERASRYAAARCGGLAAYRAAHPARPEPRIVLLIDGFASLRQAFEALHGPIAQLQQLTEIMTTGRSAGVHVVLTCDRPGALPVALAASVQQQYVFRLAGPHDYGYAGVPSDVLDSAPPGRAVLAGSDEELQFALAGGDPELRAQSTALDRLGDRLREAGVQQATRVQNAPERLEFAALPLEARGRPSYGIATHDLAPVGLPARGLAVVAGPSGSGLSTAVLTCCSAVARNVAAAGATAHTVLLTLTDGGLRRRGSWSRIAHGEARVRDTARELTLLLGGKPPKSGVFEIGAPAGSGQRAGSGPGPNPPAPGPALPPNTVIVVERPADAEGTEALPELVALARAARRSEALVLFEFEQGTGGAIWDLFSALKQPTWGLSLQPDEGENQSPFRESFGRVRRAEFPPGRGFCVEGGRVARVHVALPEGQGEGASPGIIDA